jgi:hypothetical protein
MTAREAAIENIRTVDEAIERWKQEQATTATNAPTTNRTTRTQ